MPALDYYHQIFFPLKLVTKAARVALTYSPQGASRKAWNK